MNKARQCVAGSSSEKKKKRLKRLHYGETNVMEPRIGQEATESEVRKMNHRMVWVGSDL